MSGPRGTAAAHLRCDVMDLDWGDLSPAKDALAARLEAFGGFVRLANSRIGVRRDPPGTRYVALAGEYMAARPRLTDERDRYRRKDADLPALDDALWHDTPIVDPVSAGEMREIVVPFLEAISAECGRHHIFLDAYHRDGDKVFNDCLVAFAGRIMCSLPKLHEDENTKRACHDANWDSRPCADRDRHLPVLRDEHGPFTLGFEICMDNYRRCLADLIDGSDLPLPDFHLKISGSDSIRLENVRVTEGGLYARIDQGARPARFFTRTNGPDGAPEMRELRPDACEPLPGGGFYKTLLHGRAADLAERIAIIGEALAESIAIEVAGANADPGSAAELALPRAVSALG